MDLVKHTLLLKTDFIQEETLLPSTIAGGHNTSTAAYRGGVLVLTSNQDVGCNTGLGAWKTPYTLPDPGKVFYLGIIYLGDATEAAMVEIKGKVNGTDCLLAHTGGKKVLKIIEVQPSALGQMETLVVSVTACGADNYQTGSLYIYQIGIFQD